jgi:nucleotide-binding universal stress UspA family protein
MTAPKGHSGRFRWRLISHGKARWNCTRFRSRRFLSAPETIEEVKAEKGAADRQFRNVMKRARKLATARKVELRTHVLTGHPVVSILDVAKDLGADQLVIGTTGHYALHEHMIGSRADRLVHLSLCPVLVVK